MAGFQTKKFKRMKKGTLTQDFLSSFEREVEGYACLKIKVETTSCALSPPRKHLGGVGWGEAGDTTGRPWKILEWP